MKYVNEFLNMKCSTDILRLLGPMKNWSKEISEAMAIRNRIKKVVLKDEPDKWIHLDFCSGNALAPLLTAFSLPIWWSYSYDKVERNADYSSVKYFSYIYRDIFEKEIEEILNNHNNALIFSGVHCCRETALRVVDLYNNYQEEKYLFLMPCCPGKMKHKILQSQLAPLDVYDQWAEYVYSFVSSPKKTIERDTNILSPRNVIISAKG